MEKKNLIILIVGIIAILGISSFVLYESAPKTYELKGIVFNIPSGYKESEHSSYIFFKDGKSFTIEKVEKEDLLQSANTTIKIKNLEIIKKPNPILVIVSKDTTSQYGDKRTMYIFEINKKNFKITISDDIPDHERLLEEILANCL